MYDIHVGSSESEMDDEPVVTVAATHDQKKRGRGKERRPFIFKMEKSPILGDIDEPQIAFEKKKLFLFFLATFEILGLVSLVLVGCWIGVYLEGVAWDGTSLQFNIHPIMMVLGLVYLNGNAIVIYRVLRNQAKMMVKLIHMFLQFAACICVIIGLTAVFQNHTLNNVPNLYSIHSWVGLFTVIIFFIQFTIGFLTFLFPGMPVPIRQLLMPVHVFFGLSLYVGTTVTALMGITEMTIFKMGAEYPKLVSQAVVANLLGVALALNGLIVLYMMTRSHWRRTMP